MSTWFTTRPFLTLLIGLTTGLLVGILTMIGPPVTTPHSGPATLHMPETLLHATASHSGDSLVMATGAMDAEIEGLFTLDCLTGDLQCFVDLRRARAPPRAGPIVGPVADGPVLPDGRPPRAAAARARDRARQRPVDVDAARPAQRPPHGALPRPHHPRRGGRPARRPRRQPHRAGRLTRPARRRSPAPVPDAHRRPVDQHQRRRQADQQRP